MKKSLLILLLLPAFMQAQNLALSATATASASSGGNYGPANWNDGIVNGAYFGWVGTDATFPVPSFIQYEWTSMQWMDCVVVYNVGTNFQPPTGNAVVFSGNATLQYWDGVAWNTITNFSGQGSYGDSYSITFPMVQTTRLRIANLQTSAGAHNPGFDEIEVYESQTSQNTYVDLAVTNLSFIIDTAAMEMDVLAEITNLGTQTAFGFDIGVLFDNSLPVSMNYPDTLAPTESRTFNLGWSGVWDISNPQTFANKPFCVSVHHPLDTVFANNQMCDSLAFLSNETFDLQQSLRIFPNPSNGTFSLEIPAGKYQLSIFDAAGQAVFRKSIHSNGNVVPVEIPQAKSGVYLLQIHGDGKAINKRLLIQ